MLLLRKGRRIGRPFPYGGIYKDKAIEKGALVDEGIDTDDLIDLAAEYIAYLRIERGSSPRTIEAYESDLETYRDFLFSQGIEKLSQVSR